MKKIKAIIAIACLSAASQLALAQENTTVTNESLQQELQAYKDKENRTEETAFNKKVWGRGRFMNIGFDVAQTGVEGGLVEKSAYSFNLSKGTTWLFPAKPFFGMLKVGFDVVWFDVQFSKYKSLSTGGDASIENGWTSDLGSLDGDYEQEDYFDTDMFNIGRMSATIGALGIGPHVSVAPFAPQHSKLSPLRASMYFRYQPAVSAYMVMEDGEMDASYAYTGMWNFGGVISYRKIGLGVEGRWGSGKFTSIAEMFDDELGSLGMGKQNRKFASTRIFLWLNF